MILLKTEFPKFFMIVCVLSNFVQASQSEDVKVVKAPTA